MKFLKNLWDNTIQFISLMIFATFIAIFTAVMLIIIALILAVGLVVAYIAIIFCWLVSLFI